MLDNELLPPQEKWVLYVLFITSAIIYVIAYVFIQDYSHAIVALCGIFTIKIGIERLRHLRSIKINPTPNISSVAVGTNAGVIGWPVVRNLITAPISGKPCAAYSISVVKMEPFSGIWTKIDQIWVPEKILIADEDDTNAQIHLRDVKFLTKNEPKRAIESWMHEVPDKLKKSLSDHRDQLKKFDVDRLLNNKLGPIPYRFYENIIGPDEKLYVIGYADSGMKSHGPSTEQPEDDSNSTSSQLGKSQIPIAIKKGKDSPFILSNMEERIFDDFLLDQAIPFFVIGFILIVVAVIGAFGGFGWDSFS